MDWLAPTGVVVGLGAWWKGLLNQYIPCPERVWLALVNNLCVEGVALVRSARILAASGASDDWRQAMQKKARSVLAAALASVLDSRRSRSELSSWSGRAEAEHGRRESGQPARARVQQTARWSVAGVLRALEPLRLSSRAAEASAAQRNG